MSDWVLYVGVIVLMWFIIWLVMFNLPKIRKVDFMMLGWLTCFIGLGLFIGLYYGSGVVVGGCVVVGLFLSPLIIKHNIRRL